MTGTMNHTEVGFALHTISSAPTESRAALEGVQKAFGGALPNLFGVLADSPQLIAANMALMGQLESISLSALEQQIVELATSHENKCGYCVAAHTFLSRRLPADAVRAAREGQPIGDPKLESLRKFAIEMVQTAGLPSDAVQNGFFEHYDHRQALEVILLLTVKTLQNYTNNLARTPIDPMFG